MSTDTALVVIDVQVGLIEEAYRCNEVLASINILLSKARATGTPVIYINSRLARLPGKFIPPLLPKRANRSSISEPQTRSMQPHYSEN